MFNISKRYTLQHLRFYSQKTPVHKRGEYQVSHPQSHNSNLASNLCGAIGGILTMWSGRCMYVGKESDTWKGRATGIVEECQPYIWGPGLALRVKYRFKDSIGNEHTGVRIRAGSPFRGIEPLYWWAGESIKSFAVGKQIYVNYDERDPSRCAVIPGMALIQNIPAFLTGVSLLLFFGLSKKGGLMWNVAKHQPPPQR